VGRKSDEAEKEDSPRVIGRKTKRAKLDPCDNGGNDDGEEKGVEEAAVAEPVFVGDVEVESNHIEVWKHRKNHEGKDKAPARNHRWAELPKGGPYEGMRDDGRHKLSDVSTRV